MRRRIPEPGDMAPTGQAVKGCRPWLAPRHRLPISGIAVDRSATEITGRGVWRTARDGGPIISRKRAMHLVLEVRVGDPFGEPQPGHSRALRPVLRRRAPEL